MLKKITQHHNEYECVDKNMNLNRIKFKALAYDLVKTI